jgi:selenocysteine-specific elongation factor
LAHGTPADLLLEVLDRQGPTPARTLVAEVALPTETAAEALLRLLQDGDVFVLSPIAADDALSHREGPLTSPASSSYYVASPAGWAVLLSRLTGEVSGFHHAYPLRQGMPREALKSRLKLETRLFNEAVARAAAEGALVESEMIVRLPGHVVRFSSIQQEAISRLLREFRRAPYTTPSYKGAVSALGEDVVLALIETDQLVRLGPDVLFLPETYEELLAWVRQTIVEHGSVNVAQVRDAFDTSRKYALALLEYLDDQHITKRVGDERVLR